MNAVHQLKDPAAGVAPQLLPHMHLISKHRYPIINNPSLETIVGYLLEAPKIMRDVQPVQWQLVDAPADGSIFLAWQPLDYLGTTMASDGYIWADAEQVAKSDIRGYTLEMYLHRSGYRPQVESVATHARRRYRLLSSQPGLPAPDSSLFIVSYAKANARDAIPAARIPPIPAIVQQMQQRSVIQAQGQLARKDFMIHDRANWPQIYAPQALGRPVGAPVPPGHRRGPSFGGHPEPTLEEEEDVSRGDILDFMTPRDISKTRYEQHHEWMEEVLESPYNIFQIIPGDLGLGRKGELETLTRGFFDAPMTVHRDPNATAAGVQDSSGRIDRNHAAEFKKRAEEKIQAMNAELQKMRQSHATRLQKLQKITLLNAAEKKLRSVPTSTNRRTSSTASVVEEDSDALDEIAKEVEDKTGRKIEKVSVVNLVNRGGLEERAIHRTMSNSSTARPSISSPVKSQAVPAATPTPPQQVPTQNGVVSDAQPPPSVPSAVPHVPEGQSTPRDDDQSHEQSHEQSHDQDHSMADEVFNAGSGSPPANDDHTGDDGEIPALDDLHMDVDLSGLDDQQEERGAAGGANDWLVVDEQPESKLDTGNNAPPSNGAALPSASESAAQGEASSSSSAYQQPQETNTESAAAKASGEPQPQPQPQPPGGDQHQRQNQHQLDSHNFDVNEDFENVDVDTAGDALAGYEAGNGEDLNLDDMDDNFGYAFHHDPE